MESNFQTTFIPKKPIGPRLVPQQSNRRSAISFIPILSATTFLITLATAAGFFIWQIMLSQKIATLTEEIAQARASFEPEVIERLRKVDMRIRTARQIVTNHSDPSGLFEILSTDTLKNVAFLQFTYTTKDAHTANVTMAGEALDFATLALQADVFAKNAQMINPAFSRFGRSLRELVTFDFEAGLDPKLVVYRAPSIESREAIPADLLPATTATSTR